jgi:hypothetical protein
VSCVFNQIRSVFISPFTLFTDSVQEKDEVAETQFADSPSRVTESEVTNVESRKRKAGLDFEDPADPGRKLLFGPEGRISVLEDRVLLPCPKHIHSGFVAQAQTAPSKQNHGRRLRQPRQR